MHTVTCVLHEVPSLLACPELDMYGQAKRCCKEHIHRPGAKLTQLTCQAWDMY